MNGILHDSEMDSLLDNCHDVQGGIFNQIVTSNEKPPSSENLYYNMNQREEGIASQYPPSLSQKQQPQGVSSPKHLASLAIFNQLLKFDLCLGHSAQRTKSVHRQPEGVDRKRRRRHSEEKLFLGQQVFKHAGIHDGRHNL